MKLEPQIDQYGKYADFTIEGVTQRFRLIPPGTFMMGSPSDEIDRYHDEILHEVILTTEFCLAETACPQELWQAVMGSNPSRFKGTKRPVENVNWDECQEFIRRLNQKEGTGKYRLPTEAEWEYACRANTTTPFNTGDNLTTDQANYDGNYPYKDYLNGKYIGQTTPVGSYPPNAWGLYDMHGNVCEWCSDWYDEKYYNECKEKGIVENPQGPEIGSRRVLRGGGRFSTARFCRSAYRSAASPGSRRSSVGFRLVFVP
jgi:sulfatase modifying factor 1